MRFRPLPLLTVFAIPALALLIALGAWQLERREWKVEQLADWETARDTPAFPFASVLYEGKPAQGQRIVLPPNVEARGEVRVYGRDSGGAPGWRIFEAHPAPSGLDASLVLVEAAFESLSGERRGPPPRAQHAYAPPQERGLFSAEPDIEAGEFYGFDADGMAAALGVAPTDLHAEGWVVFASDTPPPRLAEIPPARHLGYAITWFGLAAALVVFYLAFHHASGRLAFTSRKQ